MPVSSSTEHWIKPDALTINLNHFGDPDYLQVSVLAGAVVMAFKQDVIGYNAAHNYRTWPLEAANTYLETSSAYNVYARLTRSEVNARALIVYDTVLRDIEGRSITIVEKSEEKVEGLAMDKIETDGEESPEVSEGENPSDPSSPDDLEEEKEILGEPDPNYFYLYLGKISASIDGWGYSFLRIWETEFSFGTLNTNQFQNEEGLGEWSKLFRWNKVTDLIDVLKMFSSAVFRRLSIKKGEVEKLILDIKRSTDSDNEFILDGEGKKVLDENGNPIKDPNYVPISDETIPTTKYINSITENKYLRKDKDDRSIGTVASDKGFEVGKFQEGVLGTGAAMYQNAEKATFVETDFLTVRKKAFFTNITIQELKHVGGVVILSPAAMVCSKVEETTIGWKCYFNTKDADGRRVYNEFEVEDQARCQTFNLEQQADGMVGNRYYWRLVKEVGEDYIVLSKTDYDASVPNDIPQEGDNICQLGYRGNDSMRQNAIIISAYGTDAPSFKQYKGIKSYNMADAELVTKLSPFGNEIKGKFISEDGTDIKDEMDGLKVDWDKVLEQTDKEFTIWYFDYAPTLSNKPAVDWTTDELKELHEEDLFYNTKTGVAYRFEKVFVSVPDGSGGGIIETQYMWVVASDEQTIKALQAAAKAQDTADGKRRVFLAQPTPPYDAGDQWVNATYGELFDDDDLVCATPKAEGEEFSIADWRPVSYGRTSVIKNMEGEIQLIANAFELGADEKLYLKYEAGMKITAEMAKIYATQTSLDTLGNRVNDLSSAIDVTAKRIDLFSQKFSFDSDGNVTNINTSGLVTTSDYATLFSQQMDANNLVARAELSVFVKTDLNGNVSSGVYINADNVRINGITDIGSNKVSIGGFTINSDYMQAGVSTASGIMTLSATTLGFKEDGGMHVLIGPGAFGSAGEVGLYSNAPSGGFSVWGIGGAKMVARETNSEMVLIGGLALTYKFGNSFTYPANSPSGATGAWADFLVMNGNASLPNPSSCPGKVLFVKCKSGSTLSVPNGMDAKGGSKTSWNDGNSRFFISSSSNWHEFYCS